MIQDKLITEIEKSEKKIKKSQEIIDGINKRKEDVIKSYLTDDSLKNEELKIAAEPNMNYKKRK